MPRESALARAQLGDRADWSDREELLAIVADRLGRVVELIHHANFKKPHPEYAPIERPAGPKVRPEAGSGPGSGPGGLELAEPPRMSTAEEIRAFFGRPDAGTSIKYTDS